MENVSNELGDLAREISKQWFLLVPYSKIWEENGELKEELLHQKETKFSGFENSQPLQMANNAKIKI